MKITSVNKEGNLHNVYFDNGVWVGLNFKDESWEYEDENDEESYCSGWLGLDGNTLIDYDGCFELPGEVIEAVEYFEYKIDL